MLSISDSMKEAYNSDKHSFDLLAVFPEKIFYISEYGSFNSLDNNDIVADSLKFNEDISDSGSFKLGTANATSVSFDFTMDSIIGDTDIVGEKMWVFHAGGLTDQIYPCGYFRYDDPGDVVSETVVVSIYKKCTAFSGGEGEWYSFTVEKYDEDGNYIGTVLHTNQISIADGDTYIFNEYIVLLKGYRYACYYDEGIIPAEGEEEPTGETAAFSPTVVDAVPLGHFIVQSCPVVSNSNLRTLTAYDVLYSSALDEGISYGEGTSITVADILQEVEGITGFDLVGTTKYKNLLWTKADTGNTETYTVSFDNGAEFSITTKTTTLTVTSAFDSSKEHIINWLDPYSSSDGGGYRYIYQKLRNYFGINALVAGFPSDYEGSTLESFDETIDSIFRASPQITADGELTITRFSSATSDGLIYHGGSWDASPDTCDVKFYFNNAIYPTEMEFSAKSVGSYVYATPITIMGLTPSVNICSLDYIEWVPVWSGTYTYGTVRFDYASFIDEFKLLMRDQLVIGKWATVDDQISEDDDDYTNIIFYNDSDYSQRDAFFALVDTVDEYLNNYFSTTTSGDFKFRYKRYSADSSYRYGFFVNNGDGTVTLTCSYDRTISFINFPCYIAYANLGYFESVGDEATISFDDNPDSGTGDVYWTPMNEVTSIKEAYSDDPIADFAFTTDAEITFTPRDIFKAWAELQGRCFKVNRNGDGVLFAPVSGMEGLYPSPTLYPSESLYPRRGVGLEAKFASTAVIELEQMTLDTPIRYKGIRIETSDGWQDPVIYDADHASDDSYLIYDLSNEITRNFPIDNYITTIFDLIWETIGVLRINSVNAETIGRPYLESGDPLLLTAGDTTVTTTLLKRTLKGINCIYDSFEQEN